MIFEDQCQDLGLKVHEDAYRELERELVAVTEQRDRLADQIEANHKGTLMLERMVYQSREQRDRLAEEIENLKASGIHTCHDQCKRPMCAMRRQRDRLAEALRELCETLLADKPRDITDLLNKAGDALAAWKEARSE